MSDKHSTAVDRENRHIEQEARTDSDLETVVPPTSRFGGMSTWLRIGGAAVALLIILYLLSMAF